MPEPVSKIIEMRQERASLWEQAKSLHTQSEKEKRQLTAEEREQWDRINRRIDELKEIIDREERIQAVEEDLAEVQPPRVRSGFQVIERGDVKIDLTGDDENDRTLPNSDEYKRAFRAYLRDGLGGMKPELRGVIQPFYGAVNMRALTAGSSAAGGALVPEAFYRRLIEAMMAFGGMRQARTTKITTTSGATMPIPLVDDTANSGAILSEGSSVTGTEDPTFGSKDLSAYTYTSKVVRVSMQLLQDSAFDIEGWLATALGRRLGRITNNHFTLGNGSGQPEGVLTAAGAGVTDGDLTEYTDLVALEHSVDPAYRANAEWMFHDKVLATLKMLKDANEQPLWIPGVAYNAPDRILGYPYVINQDMPDGDAGEKAVLFGDFSYYFIRDVQDLRILRLEEKYAEYLQIGFLAFLRTDGLLATPSELDEYSTNQPIKYLQLAETSS